MSQPRPQMHDFLAPHSSDERIVEIRVEPNPVYWEQGRESNLLNFDFVIQGLTDRKLLLRFLKVALYDADDRLLAYRYLNHNAVGVPGIRTAGNIELNGTQTIDLPNPFYSWSPKLKPIYLRFMFTWMDTATKEEFYYGDVRVTPQLYQQQVKLHVPVKGVSTIMDGHDYTSHHRRFEMSLVRAVTGGKFASNFSRFALDFTVIGPDGNLSDLTPDVLPRHYDFHFDDARAFYTHGESVYAPADGDVVAVVNDLDDLYDSPFNMDAAIRDDCIDSLAGNRVIIKHNDGEYSHLYHLQQGSINVRLGDRVRTGDMLGRIGFSGAATTYVHLHYQLMDGPDFLRDAALPFRFSDVTLLENGAWVHYGICALDSGDIVSTHLP